MVNYPNYYPNYQNYYQQPLQQPIQQPIQQPVQQTVVPNQVLVWVQSEDEGRNYPLSAGNSIFLMNQNEDYIYAKSVDQLGKTTFIKKRLVDETDNSDKTFDLSEYIRREEIESIVDNVVQKEVERRFSQISFKPTQKKQVIVDEEED